MPRYIASCFHLQECFVLHQRRHVELFPYASLRIAVLSPHPRRWRRPAFGRQLARRAQAVRARDEQRGAATEALAQYEEARLRGELHRLTAEERRKITYAVRIAAHVRHAPEPAAGQRHGRDRWHRDQ